MPGRDAPQSSVRADRKSPETSSSPSESEESFVSAEPENTSKVRRDIVQSAATRAPPPPPGPPSSSSRRQGQKAPAPSTSSTSPVRNGRVNGRPSLEQNDSAATVTPSQKLPAPLSPPVGSYLSAQPGSSATEPRSPAQRRPPASRSSHGIETLSGPPPALSTQRSYNAEYPWRSPPTDTALTPRPAAQRPEAEDSIDAVLRAAQSSAKDRRYSEPSKIPNGAPPLGSADKASADNMTYQSSSEMYEGDEEPTIRMTGRRTSNSRQGGQGKEGRQLQEDLFLDLARADSVIDDASEVMSRSERRRSRLGIQPKASRPSSSGRPSTSGAQFPSHQLNSFQNQDSSRIPSSNQSPTLDSLATLRNDISRNRPYAASAHPMDERDRRRQRDLNLKASFSSPITHNGSKQEKSPESAIGYGRRRSVQATSPGFAPQAYRTSNLSKYASSGYQEQSPNAEGTESTVSTTAASTVWDELDDIKSRIRNLELTGKLPSTSNAAISSAFGERPPTATTTMTTLSSSPKRRQRQSASPEAIAKGLDVSDLHPLLHSALGRSKDLVNANIYRVLETTVVDALTLAAMASPSSSQVNATERQLRRKADSMCRSLTELCIALAEEKTEIQSPGPRLTSGDGIPPTLRTPTAIDPRFLRAASEDPELRSSSRVMSRLEARRTSLLGSGSGFSPRDSSQEAGTPPQVVTPIVSKFDRTSSVLRRNNKEEENKARRPPSQATTEASQTRPSPQTRVSREYVSSHPLPGYPQRSPSVQSSLPQRKSYFGSAASSPVTPSNVLPGSRRYLQASTPPSSSSDNARLAEARQRRLTSLGQSNSASQARTGRLRPAETES